MGRLEELFGVEKPIIGMIHLAGRPGQDRVDRAMREIEIYKEEGVSGVIVENYHGDFIDVEMTMDTIHGKDIGSIVVGVNCLGNTELAAYISNMHGGKFVQFDSVQGHAYDPDLDTLGQFVLGGVGFKYQPKSGNSLEYDLKEGMERCNAIVTTGDGTGIETPMSRLKEYKEILRDFPLIVGAGMNPGNVREQLSVADGGIVGSCFKQDGNTLAEVDRYLVREFMDEARKARG